MPSLTVTVFGMLVAGKTGPTSRANSKKFGNQEPAYLTMLLLTQNVLDLAVCFSVIGTILDHVNIIRMDSERGEGLVVFCAGHEYLGSF